MIVAAARPGTTGARQSGFVGRRPVLFFVAKIEKADLEVMHDLLAAGEATSVIDRRYDLSRWRTQSA